MKKGEKSYFTEDTEAGRLAIARQAAGYRSAAAAAKRLRVPDVTYRSHENGMRGYDLETAISYAKVFNCDAGYLKRGNGHAPTSDDLKLSRSATLAVLAEGIKVSRLCSLDPATIADSVLQAILDFAAESEVTDPVLFARIRLAYLAKAPKKA